MGFMPLGVDLKSLLIYKCSVNISQEKHTWRYRHLAISRGNRIKVYDMQVIKVNFKY